MFHPRALFIATVLGLTTLATWAQMVPATINYQGRLTDNSPSQTPITATVNMAFEIWDLPSGGTMLWREPAASTVPVTVTTGIFSVRLGANGVPIPASLFNGGTARYLRILANGEILTPLQTITATGYANQAQNAALAASATTAVNATQLGGVAASGYQLTTVQNCGGGQFVNAIANGSAACATPQANNLTPPVTLSASLASPNAILASTNGSTGPAISATSTSGTGVTVNSGGSGIVVNAAGTDGINATSTLAGGNGFHGIANIGPVAYGVWGESSGGHGVHGSSTTGAAGYFQGNVTVTGKATSAATAAADVATTLATKGYVDAVTVVSPRKYYLTSGPVNASQALTNCAVGFHMASLWEIFNTAALLYDTARGFSAVDAGDGPPATFGWVRTGRTSASTANVIGSANCNLWTSSSNAHYGTVAALGGPGSSWERTVPSSTSYNLVAPWVGSTLTCDSIIDNWCIQN